MHNTEWYHPEETVGTPPWNLIHNGDWSGPVEITGNAIEVSFHEDGRVRVEIPTELMVFCVGEMVRQYRIARVEDLDSRTLVGLPDGA